MTAVHIYDEEPMQPKLRGRAAVEEKAYQIKKRYGLLLIVSFVWAASMMIGCCVTGTIVHHNTAAQVRQEAAAEYAMKLEQYKADLAAQEQAQHWLSGEASREAAINQEVDAVAVVISKLSTDQQKLTEACCMLARVMSPLYPNSFKEVAEQPQQWMFYDDEANNTCSEHDRALAESIIRPYMEDGTVPKGLTANLVYAEWTPTDYVLRDSYKTTSTMHTWRYDA